MGPILKYEKKTQLLHISYDRVFSCCIFVENDNFFLKFLSIFTPWKIIREIKIIL